MPKSAVESIEVGSAMNESNVSFSGFPRSIRPVPDPLGLYIRVGRSHHNHLSDLIAAGDATCFEAVLDPTVCKAQQELRDQVLSRRLDAILDPKTRVCCPRGTIVRWRTRPAISFIREFGTWLAWDRSRSSCAQATFWNSTSGPQQIWSWPLEHDHRS